MIKNLISRLFTSRRPFKLTPAGWVFILYTIGVGAGAINTGNNLLYLVFGIFLGLILASGVLSDLSLWDVEIQFYFPDFVLAEESNILTFELINQKKVFSSFTVVVEVEGKLNNAPLTFKAHVPFVAAKDRVRSHFSLKPPERGWFQIGAIRLTTQYPFGLLKKWWNIKSDSLATNGFYVYPACFPVNSQQFERFISGADQTASSHERGEGATVYGLRDYRSNDNPRRIHWKASAKRSVGREEPLWFIREMERDQDNDFCLELPPPSEVVGWSHADQERLVRFAASLLKESKKAGWRCRLFCGREVKTDSNYQSSLRFLSLWNPGAVPSPLMEQFFVDIESRQNDRIAFSNRSSCFALLSAYQEWSSSRG